MEKDLSTGIFWFFDFSSLTKMTNKNDRVKIRLNMTTQKRNYIMQNKLLQQEHECFYCADQITMLDHLDHLIPIYYGGTNQYRNLVASCKECNLMKGTEQMVVTSDRTIRDYERLKEAYISNSKDYKTTKRASLYTVLRADLFNQYIVYKGKIIV